ncbi:MAG: MBL fold metallo-hydrolase [Myxococcota bacterium]
MASTVLFHADNHKNVLLEDSSAGSVAVEANQHVIVHEGSGMVLDPGGHKVYAKVLAETMKQLGKARLEHIFLSHQDPDIVAAINGWLMTTEATAYASNLWLRFIPHFGLDRLVMNRLKGIPDEGRVLDLAGCKLLILPAHFLHSPGNFQVYDPISKILYTGDLGTSVGADYPEVTDFEAHRPRMEPFHRRYMASGRTLRAWAQMVRGLDVEIVAPQHGAFFRGKELVGRFLDWAEGLEVGVDVMDAIYQLPTR